MDFNGGIHEQRNLCGYPDTVIGMMSSGHVVLEPRDADVRWQNGKENDAAVSMLKRWPSLLQALYGPSKRVMKDVQETKRPFRRTNGMDFV